MMSWSSQKCGLCWKSDTSEDNQSLAILVARATSDRDDVDEDSSRLSFQVARARWRLHVGVCC